MNENTQQEKEVVVDFETTMGPIKVKLYNDTPLHRDNFIKLVDNGDYEGVLFHRVINEFMVQTGDPDSKNAEPGKMLGSGQVGEEIPAEFRYPKHYHKYGALSAARTGDQVNPEKKSSGSQFYIVTGRKVSPAQISQMESQMYQRDLQKKFNELSKQHLDEIRAMRTAGDKEGLEKLRQELIQKTEAEVVAVEIPENIKTDYTTIGGTPHLDGEYTVFGEVVEGMETVEKIQHAETDRNDRPLEDIRILSAKVER